MYAQLLTNMSLAIPQKMNMDVIGVLAAAARQTVDENIYYQTRATNIAFVCPDAFDRDHLIASLRLHRNNGQRIVGPASYLAIYGHDGSLKNSAKSVFTIVGSGQSVAKDVVAATPSPDDIVSGDDTSEPDVTEEYEGEKA
jgi:hypothetical protein